MVVLTLLTILHPPTAGTRQGTASKVDDDDEDEDADDDGVGLVDLVLHPPTAGTRQSTASSLRPS